MTGYTNNISPLAAKMYGLIGVFAYLLISCGYIREEYIHYADRQEIQKAKLWPPVSAQIGDFSVKPVYISDAKYFGHNEYIVRVQYKYVVDGVSHFSQQQKFLDYPNRFGVVPPAQWGSQSFLTYTKETEQAMAEYFAVGTGHVVRYDPANPSTAYIDIRISPDNVGDLKRRMGLFGAFVLGISIWWVLSSGLLKMR